MNTAPSTSAHAFIGFAQKSSPIVSRNTLKSGQRLRIELHKSELPPPSCLRVQAIPCKALCRGFRLPMFRASPHSHLTTFVLGPVCGKSVTKYGPSDASSKKARGVAFRSQKRSRRLRYAACCRAAKATTPSASCGHNTWKHYEDAIKLTSTKHAPWYIITATEPIPNVHTKQCLNESAYLWRKCHGFPNASELLVWSLWGEAHQQRGQL